MIHEIRPATIEDTLYLAKHLPADDLNEILGWGHNPFQVLPESFSQLEDPISFFVFHFMSSRSKCAATFLVLGGAGVAAAIAGLPAIC